MVYGADAMLPVEIDTPTWRRENLSEEDKYFIIVLANPFSVAGIRNSKAN